MAISIKEKIENQLNMVTKQWTLLDTIITTTNNFFETNYDVDEMTDTSSITFASDIFHISINVMDDVNDHNIQVSITIDNEDDPTNPLTNVNVCFYNDGNVTETYKNNNTSAENRSVILEYTSALVESVNEVTASDTEVSVDDETGNLTVVADSKLSSALIASVKKELIEKAAIISDGDIVKPGVEPINEDLLNYNDNDDITL